MYLPTHCGAFFALDAYATQIQPKPPTTIAHQQKPGTRATVYALAQETQKYKEGGPILPYKTQQTTAKPHRRVNHSPGSLFFAIHEC